MKNLSQIRNDYFVVFVSLFTLFLRHLPGKYPALLNHQSILNITSMIRLLPRKEVILFLHPTEPVVMEVEIYVCFKQADDTWSDPLNMDEKLIQINMIITQSFHPMKNISFSQATVQETVMITGSMQKLLRS